EQATDAAVLTQGDSRPWQEQQAERVVEALRPPLDVPTLSDVDAWSGDERPTMQAWRQMLQVAQQEAKRLQEAPPLPGDDRSQMETEPAFALAVQLRDLLHQEPTSRMC
ncbi:MAG: hypothetical protein J2P37_35405, partial [Ktedonobacteraceae bacterium]|nr:hypothetical protein [Ktedonobacteraceae bacterium]